MRKNLGNKQVIRAITIGISAIMAMTPATAFAAEGDTGDGMTPQPDTVVPAKTEEQTVADTATDAGNAVKDASAGVANVLDAADAATDTTNTTETKVLEVPSEETTKPTTTDTTDADNDIKEAAGGLKEEQDDISTAKDELTGVENNGIVDGAKENLEEANGAKEDAENAVVNAAYNLDAADKFATDTEKKMNDASDAADRAVLTISTAAFEARANAAKQEFDKILADAKDKFDANQEKYNGLILDYENQLKTIEEAKNKYNDALTNAGADADIAKGELVDAQIKAEALKDAADKAATLMASDAAILIIDAQTTRNSDTKTNWSHCDELFKLIVANYYGPVCQKMTGIKVNDFTYFGNDERNYAVVTGKDEKGNDVTKYLNYKVDKDNQLIIFEKSPEIFTGGETDKAGFVYLDGQTVIELVKQGSLEKLIASEEVVKLTDEEGKVTYAYKKNTTGIEEGLLDDNQTASDKKRTESYYFDAVTGQLVKTVSDDVTTITYSDAVINGTTKYNSKSEAEAAANAAKNDLVGKDFDVTVNTSTEYTSSTTYTPTFTISINLNREQSNTTNNNDAVNQMIERARTIIGNDFNILTMQQSIDLESKNTSHTEHSPWLGIPYTVTDNDVVNGNLTISFVPKDFEESHYTTYYSNIADFFNIFEDQKEEVRKEQLKKANDIGNEIKDIKGWDGKLCKATVTGIKGKTYTNNDSKDTKQEAENAAKQNVEKKVNDDYQSLLNKVIDKLKAKFSTETITSSVVINMKTTTKAVDKYSYQIDYQKATENTANQDISTTTWDAAQVLVLSNKYYDEGDKSELTDIENDKDFQAYLKVAKEKKDAYDVLLNRANVANGQLIAAKDKVDTLKKQIDGLKFNVDNDDTIGRLNLLLETALKDWKKAQDSYDNLTKKVADAKKAYNDTIERLREENDTEDNDEGITPATNRLPRANAVINPNAVPLAAAPIANRTRNAGINQNVADGQGNAAVIDEEPVALAAEPKNSTQEGEKKIEDEQTPLAAKPIEQKNIFAWWWFLILAALGIGGYEGNKQFQKKKTGKKTISDGKKNK